VFTFRANNQLSFSLKEVIEVGSYNCLMQNQPLYDSSAHTFKSSHDLFRSAFSEGFPWELMEVFSGKNDTEACIKPLTEDVTLSVVSLPPPLLTVLLIE